MKAREKRRRRQQRRLNRAAYIASVLAQFPPPGHAVCLWCRGTFPDHELTNRYGSYTCLPCTDKIFAEMTA